MAGNDILLIAVELQDAASLTQGSLIAATESIDQASFTVESTSTYLAAVESLDTVSVDVLQGQLAELAAVEAKDTASINGRSSILVEFSGTERPDRASFHELQGIIGSLRAIESLDRALITVSTRSSLGLAGIENADTAWFPVRQIPITIIRKTVVMHLFGHAVTEYENFNFNSLAHCFGVFLGVNENGLFILGGKDDLGVPIEADIRTGIHDLGGDGVIKLPKEAWIGYRTDGQLELDIEVDENRAPYPYFFDKTSRRITEARATLGKGLEERFYTFSLKNLAGSDFDLQSLRILGNILQRKRR